MIRKLMCFLFHGKHRYWYTDYGLHDHWIIKCRICERQDFHIAES